MEYKAIAIDLDGTLLNSNKVVSKNNISAIERAAKNGVKIIICSGRIFPEAYNYVKNINGISDIAACNGAVIKNIFNMETIFEKSIETNAFLEIMEKLREKQIFFNVYFEDKVYIENENKKENSFYKKNAEGMNCERIYIDDIKKSVELNKVTPNKIIIMSKNYNNIAELRCIFEKRNDIKVTSSYKDNIEITGKNVDKQSAIEFLCNRYYISRDEMMAIGDGENDLPMLKCAGMPVVMGNASDVIKRAAGFVTETNDNDGVALAINKYIL